MPKPDSPNFDRAYELQRERGTQHPYISKSRVVQFNKNPRHFYMQYVLGMRQPTNYYMWRGSEVHKVIEDYYNNVIAEYERSGGIFVDLMRYLPPAHEWWPWATYIGNFIAFEQRRRDRCASLAHPTKMSDFIPVGVEAEVWDWDHEVPRMGFSDIVLRAASLPDVETDEGVVVIDVKTGKTPQEKYRDEGIYLELDYYAMLFRDEYDVTALAGYYPRANDLIVTEPSDERQSAVEALIAELLAAGEDEANYPIAPGPLCCWGEEPEKQSAYYPICHECRWATPDGPGPTYRDENKNPV